MAEEGQRAAAEAAEARPEGLLKVEEVLAERTVGGGLEYYVRWTATNGRPHQTWERPESFEPRGLVEEFRRRAAGEAGAGQKRRHEEGEGEAAQERKRRRTDDGDEGGAGEEAEGETAAEAAAEAEPADGRTDAEQQAREEEEEEEEDDDDDYDEVHFSSAVSFTSLSSGSDSEREERRPAVPEARLGIAGLAGADFDSDSSSDESYVAGGLSPAGAEEPLAGPPSPETSPEAERMYYLSRVDGAQASFKNGDDVEIVLGLKYLKYHGNEMLMAFVKWRDRPICSFVPLFEARIRVPQLVLDYYESCISVRRAALATSPPALTSGSSNEAQQQQQQQQQQRSPHVNDMLLLVHTLGMEERAAARRRRRLVEKKTAADGGARALLYMAEGEAAGVGALELCRAAAMNSLSLAMIRFFYATLQAWRADGRVGRVVVYAAHSLRYASGGGQGRRRLAFCAGGDLKEFVATDIPQFTHAEYRLDLLLARYPKPLLSLVDGVVMGGGAGVGLLAAQRVLTRRSFFAMPEARIGWVTDCGGSWLLAAPRVERQGAAGLGAFLGMTGARCGPADLALAGIGEWYCADDGRTEALLRALLFDAERPPEAALARLAEPLPAARESQYWPHRAAIARCFTAPTAAAVLARLDAAAAAGDEWAGGTAATLRAQCPTSAAVVHELLRRAAGQDIATCLSLEYRAAVRLAPREDLQEGVAAVLVRKDGRPRFRPASLADVPDVRAWFAPMQQAELLWSPVPGVDAKAAEASDAGASQAAGRRHAARL